MAKANVGVPIQSETADSTVNPSGKLQIIGRRRISGGRLLLTFENEGITTLTIEDIQLYNALGEKVPGIGDKVIADWSVDADGDVSDVWITMAI